MPRPPMFLAGPVLGSPDPLALAAFYRDLLGWEIVATEGPAPDTPCSDGWAKLRAPDGSAKLEIQYEPMFEPPVWPSESGRQQMLVHLDIGVDDLEEGMAWAIEVGATLADHQPQADVRVMTDPHGHLFCLFRLAL